MLYIKLVFSEEMTASHTRGVASMKTAQAERQHFVFQESTWSRVQSVSSLPPDNETQRQQRQKRGYPEELRQSV